VQANGLMEGSTIAAILGGSIAGGLLTDWNVSGALVIVTVCYCAAAGANLLIPKLPAARAIDGTSVPTLLREFTQATRDLLRFPEARFSLTGTSVFWGAGATLRFLLVAWVPVALGIANYSMPAYLNGAVGIGVVLGAALAGKFVSLQKVDRTLPAGVLIGIAVCLLAGTTSTPVAFAVVTITGACGSTAARSPARRRAPRADAQACRGAVSRASKASTSGVPASVNPKVSRNTERNSCGVSRRRCCGGASAV